MVSWSFDREHFSEDNMGCCFLHSAHEEQWPDTMLYLITYMQKKGLQIVIFHMSCSKWGNILSYLQDNYGCLYFPDIASPV